MMYKKIKMLGWKLCCEYNILRGFIYDYKIYNNVLLKIYKKIMGFDEFLGLIIRLYYFFEKGLVNEKFKKELLLKNVLLLLIIFLENNKIDYSDVYV